MPYVQERVLKLLEFVVCSLNFVPVAELAGFLGVLTGKYRQRFCIRVAIVKCLILVIRVAIVKCLTYVMLPLFHHSAWPANQHVCAVPAVCQQVCAVRSPVSRGSARGRR